MGLFRRRASNSTEPQPESTADRTDAGLAVLAARIAVRIGATDVRIEGSDASDLSIVTATHILPLYNLIARLRSTPEQQWDETITRHVGAILSGSPDVGTLSPDALRAQIRTRLFPDSDFPIQLEYARPFATGLVLALVIDFPQTVLTISDSHLPELALGLDELYEYGRRNVNAEPVEAHAEIAPGLFLDEGESMFIATRASDLPELLTLVGVDAPHGVLFTVPSRHRLMYTPISPGVVERLTSLISYTQGQVSGQLGALAGGPLSGNLYFWDANGYECVGADDLDGESFAVTVTAPLQRALEAVGEEA